MTVVVVVLDVEVAGSSGGVDELTVSASRYGLADSRGALGVGEELLARNVRAELREVALGKVDIQVVVVGEDA